MISFRYHIVSMVAVLLALAAGVALGGGPLSEIGRGGDESAKKVEQRNVELTQQLNQAGVADVFQDEFAEQTSSRVVRGTLGRPVVLVTMPGADDDQVKSLSDLVARAGGKVAATYAVQSRLVDPNEKSLVDKLGIQVIQDVEDTGVRPSAPAYDRMGRLIGFAVATTNDRGEAAGPAAKDILSSLRGAEILTRTGGGDQRGSLVLVVLGDEPSDPAIVDNVYSGLLVGLATAADGVAVLGSTGSAENGLLKALRDDVSFSANVSSADSGQTMAGQVAVILALGADARGKVGQYGAAGIDGVVPRG